MADRLRPLWDFDDLGASEHRFADLLEHEPAGPDRAEVLTQLARVCGLRGDFDAGDRLLDEAEASAGSSGPARARIRLERGRLRRSAGDERGGFALFEEAFAEASSAGNDFLAVDAAHMAALAAPDRVTMLAWSDRGVEIAQFSADTEVRYWLGPLLNNLGWAHYAAAEYELAHDAFQRALEARLLDPERTAEVEIARYALGKTLRALGRPSEVASLLEKAVAWARGAGKPDGWFHEELAEDYAALGRRREAREQATLALPLLVTSDPALAGDPARLHRLRELAEAEQR